MALKQQNTLSRTLAPEEIRPGQYVAVLSHVIELLPPSCDDAAWRSLSLLRFEFLPWDDFLPLKVKGVCLPFVLVKAPNGKWRTIDVRRHRLAKLDNQFGEVTYRRYRRASKKAARPKRNLKSKRKSK